VKSAIIYTIIPGTNTGQVTMIMIKEHHKKGNILRLVLP
jgi:hypothetical protein